MLEGELASGTCPAGRATIPSCASKQTGETLLDRRSWIDYRGVGASRTAVKILPLGHLLSCCPKDSPYVLRAEFRRHSAIPDGGVASASKAGPHGPRMGDRLTVGQRTLPSASLGSNPSPPNQIVINKGEPRSGPSPWAPTWGTTHGRLSHFVVACRANARCRRRPRLCATDTPDYAVRG